MSSSDENFNMCLECFDLFVTMNMRSWNKALSKNELPKPLNDIANELGDKCRPACGCKMIPNERIGSISECKNVSIQKQQEHQFKTFTSSGRSCQSGLQ